MKPRALMLMLIAASFSALAANATGTAPASQADAPVPPPMKAPVSQQMNITVRGPAFVATLETNPAAVAFKALLPLTLDMHDVNRNEKAFDLPSELPATDASPRTIRTGDLMLWSGRTVVVFYQSFATSYRYTRLGKIADPEGLAEALGAGNATVTFELK